MSKLKRTIHGLTLLLLPILFGYSAGQAQTYTPDFSISLEKFQSQALKPKEEVWVIDFWATWCGPCVMAIPHMKELHEKFEGKSVRFLSISWDRNEQQWLAGLDHFKMPWNHLIVPKGQEGWLEENFPHSGIPTAFVVDRSGKAKKVNNVYKLEAAVNKALK